MKGLSLVIFCYAVMVAASAYPHGKAINLATPADVAVACGGAKMAPVKKGKKTGDVRWMKVESNSGSVVAIAGIHRAKTTHGYLVQATCFSPVSNAILTVALMRAMPDETKALRYAMSEQRWWTKTVSKVPEPVAILYTSVRHVRDVYKYKQEQDHGIQRITAGLYN